MKSLNVLFLILGSLCSMVPGAALADSFSIIRDGSSYTCTQDSNVPRSVRSCSIPSTNLTLPGTSIEFFFNGCSVTCSRGQEGACNPARFDSDGPGSFTHVQADCRCI